MHRCGVDIQKTNVHPGLQLKVPQHLWDDKQISVIKGRKHSCSFGWGGGGDANLFKMLKRDPCIEIIWALRGSTRRVRRHSEDLFQQFSFSQFRYHLRFARARHLQHGGVRYRPGSVRPHGVAFRQKLLDDLGENRKPKWWQVRKLYVFDKVRWNLTFYIYCSVVGLLGF